MSDAMNKLQIDHMNIAARAWAGEKAREVSGIVVDHVLNQTQAKVPLLELIGMAEEYEERFLRAWLHRNLMEFTQTYYADCQERIRQLERIAEDAIATQNRPIVVIGEHP